TSSMTKSKKGAEAKYNMAAIHFINKDLDTAKTLCYEIINQVPSYENWVVNSFILIGDIYAADGSYYQAKATWQSIIDNYDGVDTDLADICNEKIYEIEAEETIREQNRIDSLSRDSLLINFDTLIDRTGGKTKDDSLFIQFDNIENGDNNNN
ncbi:MAG: hypothetical protein IH946_07355, partial [Bacteroidetes bacterium]|nr:hypothetical protein [Bacteroidota bacterium]